MLMIVSVYIYMLRDMSAYIIDSIRDFHVDIYAS